MRVRRLLAFAAIYFLWGGTYLAVRTVVLVTPPFAAASLRFLLSGLVLLAVSGPRPGSWPTRREWRNSVLLGFLMFALNYGCFFWAEQRLYSGVAAVIVATMPVWVLAAELLSGQTRRLSQGSVVGSFLGIGGVAMMTRGSGAQAASHRETLLATAVLLLGTICWSAGSVWSRSLALPVRQSVRSALQMGFGGLFLGALALFAGEGRRLGPALRAWHWTTSLWFVYLVAASIVAFTAYVWLLHHEPVSRVASYAYVNPLVALALGVGFAHEHVGRWQLAGGALVLGGVFSTLRARAAVPAEAEP